MDKTRLGTQEKLKLILYSYTGSNKVTRNTWGDDQDELNSEMTRNKQFNKGYVHTTSLSAQFRFFLRSDFFI